MKRTYVAALAVLGSSPLGAGACGKRDASRRRPGQKVALAEALRPAFFAAALQARRRALPRHAALQRRAVGAPRRRRHHDDRRVVDRAGNYRFREENDRDGGREVVLYGRELAVALRYGKMIRRVAEEPEPSRMLEEALGAPWAVFELAASRMHGGRTLDGAATERLRAARAPTSFKLPPGDGAAVEATGAGAPLAGLRAWRSNSRRSTRCRAALVVDDATGALVAAAI